MLAPPSLLFGVAYIVLSQALMPDEHSFRRRTQFRRSVIRALTLSPVTASPSSSPYGRMYVVSRNTYIHIRA